MIALRVIAKNIALEKSEWCDLPIQTLKSYVGVKGTLQKIYVAGHLGMVGSAIVRKLEELASCSKVTRTRDQLDLTNQSAVQNFFADEKPDVTIIAAAKVGGILANNKFPAEFIYQNLLISSNLVHQSFISGVSKLLQIGSSCIYPKDSPQPILENYLLSSPLEPTNEPYAIAKIASIKLCESYNRQYGVDYRSIMPTKFMGQTIIFIRLILMFYQHSSNVFMTPNYKTCLK